jgi:hypothetical protein
MPGIVRRWKIRKLENNRADIVRYYAAERKARKELGASAAQLQELDCTAFFEAATLSHQIEVLKTEPLVKRALRYDLPIPNWNDEEAWEPGWRYLKPDHFAKLRAAIREEEKARREQILAWIPLITALTGIGGVIVAILALLKS